MNFFQRLRFLIFGTPYVVLVDHDHDMHVRPVKFINGQPFALRHGALMPETRCKLLPNGRIFGQSYVESWEPATPNMNYYFNLTSE